MHPTYALPNPHERARGSAHVDLTSPPAPQPVAPPGWYPDPAGTGRLRFFDGVTWTERMRSRPEAAVQTSWLVAGVLPAARVAQRSLAAAARLRARWKLAGRAGTGVSIAGGALLLYFAWVLIGTNMWTSYQQDRLRSELIATAAAVPATTPTTAQPAPVFTTLSAAVPSTAAPTTTTPSPPKPYPVLPDEGEPVGTIKIDKIGLDWVFAAGTEVSTLKKGPGVWKYGSFPGTPGNATISAHRTTYGGPFRRIHELEIGDRITVSVPGQPDAIFEVRGRAVVRPSSVTVTDSTPGVRLTLTTCEPIGSDAKRLVVQAELIEGAYVDNAIRADGWTFQGS